MSGEDCRRCGANNPAWSAPSPLWNLVMRGNDINGSSRFGDMVCARCFMELAEEMGAASLWRVYPERVAQELVTTTPSGRVWDPDQWLWVEPPPMSPDPEDVELVALSLSSSRMLRDAPMSSWRMTIAHVVLAALGSRLLPRGGSSETKYRVTGVVHGVRDVWMGYIRTIGEASEACESALNARQEWWSDFRAEQRTITRFPDGSELVGPWLNVEEGTP